MEQARHLHLHLRPQLLHQLHAAGGGRRLLPGAPPPPFPPPSPQNPPNRGQNTVDLFKTLNTYKFLSDAGIVPSSSTTYSADAINAALKKARGVDATIQCTSKGVLDEVWYSFNYRGSVQTGTAEAVAPDGSKSSCSGQVQYLPKSGSSSPTSTTTSATSTTKPTSTSTGGALSGKGYVYVTQNGQQSNADCIISTGKWYHGGTCATYTASPSGSGFTLSTSKGPCSMTSSLSCASGNTASVFQQAAGGLVTYAGQQTFFAASAPSGSQQVAIETGSDALSVQLQWAQQ